MRPSTNRQRRARVSEPIRAAISDSLTSVPLDRIRIAGFLGERIDASAKERLPNVDLSPLLAGFQKKPGSHPWIGEHMGKWLHASTLAWANSGDPALKAKLDRAVADLIACQEADGYLGTYIPAMRFGLFRGADWDVWSHKYCLIGLVTYHSYTSDRAALDSAKRAADLLISTFGPGKKRLIAAGTHVGMAATSVLEPIVLLYRATGEPRYLEFAKRIVDEIEAPDGPRIVSTLTRTGKVNKTANGKAYEMLSNLVGLVELYKTTGERRYLTPILRAWDDIVENQLYITGSTSYGEHFHDDHDLPVRMSANVGETCVTVTWIQLTEALFCLTGEAKYGTEIERSLYNHLSAAQRPDGREWCYYTSLEGTKPYGPGISCCVSSGPRGMAIVPRLAVFGSGTGQAPTVTINLLEEFDADAVPIGDRGSVGVTLVAGTKGQTIRIRTSGTPARFSLKIRAPRWASPMTARLDRATFLPDDTGFITIPERLFRDGATISLSYSFAPRLIPGTHRDTGLTALGLGPFVLATNSSNSSLPTAFARDPSIRRGRTRFSVLANTTDGTAEFSPFADAGIRESRYRVWLRSPGSKPTPQSEWAESRSRDGNTVGSIVDGDPATFVVTFDGAKAKEDWFAIELARPKTVAAVVFAHGQTFHDGGWFDSSGAPPRVEIRVKDRADWRVVGPVAGYPKTTETDSRGLRPGQVFLTPLAMPARDVIAIRVVGKPAHGDSPNQNFASCAELSPR